MAKVKRESFRKRREWLRRSLECLVDQSAGTPVTWIEGKGWEEETEA